jgi:hypothetical protein
MEDDEKEEEKGNNHDGGQVKHARNLGKKLGEKKLGPQTED